MSINNRLELGVEGSRKGGKIYNLKLLKYPEFLLLYCDFVFFFTVLRLKVPR